MLHKLKPVPRALIILGIVGIAGYALTMVDFSKFKSAEPVVKEAAVIIVAPPSAAPTEPPPNTSTPPLAEAAPASPAAPAGLTPATNNSGLDAVLQAGKK